MTEMRRVTVSLPDALDKKILEMRKVAGFERCTYSEIVRRILVQGIEDFAKEKESA